MGRQRDEFWDHAKNENGRFECNYCKQDFPGGASRIKAHLAGIPGHDIKACNAVPQDVQEKAQATQKKREAQVTQGTNKKLKSVSTSASKSKTKTIKIVTQGKEEYGAEIILNDVMDRLIANVSSLATEHINFELSFKVDLLETLFKIKFVLGDAQKRQLSDESMGIWLTELRNVAYDADNVLDKFSYESFWQKVRIQNQMMDQVCNFSLCNFDEVKAIKQSLDKIVNDVADFGLRMELVNSIPKISLDMNTDSLLDDLEVVGRKHDIKKIVNLLINSNNQQVISVLPIVGMAGLGKTTLAKLVYNHELIKKHFDVLVWVYVGKKFNVEEILRKIIGSLREDLRGPPLAYARGVHQIFAEILGANKYLLILDDVHNEDPKEWDTLKDYLLEFNSNSNIGNNIVVTTRSDNVGQIMKIHHPPHHLEKLSKDDCWSIMKKRTFIDGRTPLTLDLEVIGREIAKRCGGVPWAARVLGRTMSFQFDKNKWLEIQNNKIWDLLDEDNSDMFPVLKLCFDQLPTPSLKRCFAYCAIFPKDYDMEKDEVIQYWMAEGFLLAKEANMEMEDIGNMYFKILLATSFFQNARKDAYGNIISCKMYDLVHDFALSISKFETSILEGDSVDDGSSIQHLFARHDGKTTLVSSFTNLRTLISENFNFDIMSSNFKCLRVLKLFGDKLFGDSRKELPDSIEQLIHLRLLQFSDSLIGKLPKSITKLYNLQTLRIEGSRHVRELPEDLSNLINLRHIHINWAYYCIKTPKNMSMLTCLQTLTFFGVGSEDGYRITELGALKNLKGEIVIKNLERVKDEEEAKSAKLKEKEISNLGLYWDEEYHDSDDKDEKVLEGLQPHPNLKRLTIEVYEGKKFPSWVGSSLYHNLIEINLIRCWRCKEVPTLGQLPCLRVLEIIEMGKVRSIGSEFYFYSDGSYRNTTTILFPALRILKLEGMVSLEEWKDAKELTTADEVFPCLEELTLRSCYELRDLPDSLHTCVSLQKLVVSHCHNLRYLPGVRSIIRSGIEDPPSGLQYLENGDCPLPSSSSTSSIHPSLQKLKLIGCGSLLLDQIQHFIALKILWIQGFDEMVALPEWLGNLSSLQKLYIVDGWKLRYLPTEEAMRRLTQLKMLEIYHCPNLKDNERSKIDHIPWVKISNYRYSRPSCNDFED
ncbi:putative disease resistance protein RGA4 [Quercus robur]|uniref:putative disease resistance protein RGA4 n=1 Tax=Quercus robur TaxID=38942 RepID=UPI0021623533|nr:putative disease resistance protein RGA4 [Quercus robur]XP_050256174.1 putative disease resistance protein RGA4 [Quercus robur]